MIPDYYIDAYQELQSEKGVELSFEEAQDDLARLCDIYQFLSEAEQEFIDYSGFVDCQCVTCLTNND